MGFIEKGSYMSLKPGLELLSPDCRWGQAPSLPASSFPNKMLTLYKKSGCRKQGIYKDMYCVITPRNNSDKG
jgi:hypothetical protein